MMLVYQLARAEQRLWIIVPRRVLIAAVARIDRAPVAR